MKFIATFLFMTASFTALAQTNASVSCEHREIASTSSACGGYNFPCMPYSPRSNGGTIVTCKIQQQATALTLPNVQSKLRTIQGRVNWPSYATPTISCDTVGVASDVAKCEARLSVKAYTGYEVSQDMTDAIRREIY